MGISPSFFAYVKQTMQKEGFFMSKKTLITGTLILTSASLITKVIGFFYRVYMVNLIGSEGMGLY